MSYRSGICWSHVGKTDTQCGLDASLYEAYKENSGTFIEGIKVRVWLCDFHKAKASDDGYTLTLVLK